ncbi:MAG: carbon-nitrogen family hydrolase [Litorilinea sp.]
MSDAQPGSNSSVQISLVQMDCILGDPKENFARATPLIAEAAQQGSQLVVLPELWSTAYDLENAAAHASPLAQRAGERGWFGRLAGLARKNKIWLTGSLLEAQADGRYYNTMPIYGPDGRLKGVYRKIHLFRLMEEEIYLSPGQNTTLLELPWGKTGLAICYDLRFPEMFRQYALLGAQLILMPAEWPNPRREHWRTLIRARAIENQCFVAACNRVGSSKGAEFFGASAIVDPWGETLIEGGEQAEILTATIDLATVEAVRQRIPVFSDRRPELY